LIERLKQALGEAVVDVRPSSRLTDSPVCLVADTGGVSLHLARMLRQHGDGPAVADRKVLEINPSHSLIKRLDTLQGDAFSDGANALARSSAHCRRRAGARSRRLREAPVGNDGARAFVTACMTEDSQAEGGALAQHRCHR